MKRFVKCYLELLTHNQGESAKVQSAKCLHFADGCAAAFANAAPSFNPFDLLIGVAGAVALRLMVYCKGKNAKKYRKGVEYGSARWSA